MSTVPSAGLIFIQSFLEREKKSELVFNLSSCSSSFKCDSDEHLQSDFVSCSPATPLSLQVCSKTFWSSVSPSQQKDLFLFPFCFFYSLDKFPLEWSFQSWMGLLRNSCRGWGCVCTVTVMVIRLLFHLESNIMMTLKLWYETYLQKGVEGGGKVGPIWVKDRSLGGEREVLQRRSGRTAGSSELLWGGDPDVGTRLLLDD